MPGDRTFRSKIDRWLVLVVTVGLGMTWLAPLRRLGAGRPLDALDVLWPLVLTAFLGWTFTTTYYVITDDSLIVRAGPIRRTVPLHAVQRLRATHNPLSSPALSLDRIEVSYGSKRILISPDDKRGFVRAVVERAPAVVLVGLSAS